MDAVACRTTEIARAARRRDRARAAVALRGPRAHRRRGALPRTAGRGDGGRRHHRPRPGRRERAARRPRTTRQRSPRRSSACSRTARSRSGSPPAREAERRARGSRRQRTTRGGCASSWSRWCGERRACSSSGRRGTSCRWRPASSASGRRSARCSTTASLRRGTGTRRALRAARRLLRARGDARPPGRQATSGRQAIVAEDPRTAALVISARTRVPVIAEVHGNWRHSTRLYGSSARRASRRSSTRSTSTACATPTPCGRSPAIRQGSSRTCAAARPTRCSRPTATSRSFTERPVAAAAGAAGRAVRRRARAVQERRRPRRSLAPGGAAACRDARLVVVGKGSRREAIERGSPDEHVEQLPPGQVAAQLDAATVLVLPSRYEGLGRVVIEAFARGRGVVASRAGGILDLVDDGEQGCSSTPRTRTRSRTHSSVCSSDRPLAERLGAAAHARFPRVEPDARAVRGAHAGAGRRPSYTGPACVPTSSSSSLKNGVYRSIGEAATGARRVDGRPRAHALRAHVPQGQRRRRQHGHRAAGRVRRADGAARGARLHRRLARRRDRPLRRRRAAAAARGADHLRRRVPRQPRERRPDPAALRLSGRAVRRRSATSAARGRCRTTSTSRPAASSTGRSTGASSPSSSAAGVRVESHGIGHRPLADLEVDEAAREITLSKLRLEEALGRPVRAFAYVKGSEAHYRPVHLSLLRAGGLRRRLHVDLGRRTARTPIRSSSTATTSSRTRRAPSSSCSPAPAT